MKKISRRNFLSICGAMAAVGAMTACGGSSSGSSTATSSTGSAAASAAAGDGTKKIVKVAVMCPMSGQSQQFYAQYQAAIQAASDVIAEDNMLPDYELEFEYIDDKGTTDGARPPQPLRWISTDAMFPSAIC